MEETEIGRRMEKVEIEAEGKKTTFKEVKQTPLENAVTTYRFISADAGEGLNYSVSSELYNSCMKAVVEAMPEVVRPLVQEVTGSVPNRRFLEDFYRLYTKWEDTQP